MKTNVVNINEGRRVGPPEKSKWKMSIENGRVVIRIVGVGVGYDFVLTAQDASRLAARLHSFAAAAMVIR